MKRKQIKEQDLPFDILNNILPFLNTIELQVFWKANKKFNQIASRFMVFRIYQLLRIPKALQLYSQRLKICSHLDYTKWRQNLSSVNVKELIIIGVYNMVIYIPDSIEKCRTESNNNFHFENILESRLQVLHVGVFYPSKLLPQSLTRLVIDSITTDVIVKDPMEKDISLPNLKYLVIKSCYHNELKHIQLPDYMIALDVHLNGSYFKMPRIVENLRLLPPCPSWLCDHINPGAFGWPEVVYNLDASRVVLFKDSHLFMCWNFIKVLKCKHMCGLVYPNSLRELTIDKLCDKDIFPESLERLTLPIEYCQRYFRDVLFYKYNNVTKNGDYYTIISSKLSQLVTKHVC